MNNSATNHVYKIICVSICAVNFFSADALGQLKDDSFDSFFKQSHNGAVDYIMSLFDESDIVILGERDHRDITQYEFIDSLISDSRFIERVGHVYTEVGVFNKTDDVNRLINANVTDTTFYRMLCQYLPTEDYTILWEKTNRSVFLSAMHRVNTTVAKDKPIFLGLTDVSFDWDNISTADQYHEFESRYMSGYIRDRIMAENFLTMWQKQVPGSDGRKKALYITNAPHATPKGGRTADFIRSDCRAGQVKIVFINWCKWWEDDKKEQLFFEGVSDDAFQRYNGAPIGFNIKGTPFESANWMREYNMGDVVDGMIYDKSAYQWVLSIGIDKLFDMVPGLEDILIERQWIIEHANGINTDKPDPEDIREYYGKEHRFPHPAVR